MHNTLLNYGFKNNPQIEFEDEIEREVALTLKPYAGKLDSIGFKDEDRVELKKKWRDFFIDSEYYKNDSVQSYLTQILKKIIPEEIIKKYNLRIYLTTELGFNAAAYQNGIIQWNLYNFIYLNNEAEIANILAHEISHVMASDYKSLELLYDKLKRSGQFTISTGIRRYEMLSQNNEYEADRLGLGLLEKSGYRNDAYKHCFNLFNQFENNNNFKRAKVRLTYNYIKTHPGSKERKDSLDTYVKEINGEEFLVNEELFNSIKKETTPFILEKMLHFNLYSECLELGLEEFMVNESDDALYYILESTRRFMYMDKSLKQKPILSSDYLLGNNYDFIHYRNQLFSRKLDSLVVKKVSDKDINSYEEYFAYFYNIAKEKDLKECYLPMGLYDYYTNNSKEYMDKLVSSDPSYTAFVAYVKNPEATVKDFTKTQLLHIRTHFNKYSYFGFDLEQDYPEDSLIPVFNAYVEQQYNKVKPENGELIKVYEQIDDDYELFAKNYGFYSFYWFLEEEEINIKKFDQYLLKPDLGVYMLENQLKRMDILDMFHCRDGQKVAQILIASQGLGNHRFWTYSIVLYSSSIADNEFKQISFDVGIGTVTRNSVLGVLKYNVITNKNLSK